MTASFEIYTDILVLGSEPAGFAAAYTTAKIGVEVILVEQIEDIGEISTSGLWAIEQENILTDCITPGIIEFIKAKFAD